MSPPERNLGWLLLTAVRLTVPSRRMISGPYRGRQTQRRRALYEILHGLELEGCLHVLPGAVLQSLNPLAALWTQAIKLTASTR